jgi:hypothetical protein
LNLQIDKLGGRQIAPSASGKKAHEFAGARQRKQNRDQRRSIPTSPFPETRLRRNLGWRTGYGPHPGGLFLNFWCFTVVKSALLRWWIMRDRSTR